jgi:hypothetical protein
MGDQGSVRQSASCTGLHHALRIARTVQKKVTKMGMEREGKERGDEEEINK